MFNYFIGFDKCTFKFDWFLLKNNYQSKIEYTFNSILCVLHLINTTHIEYSI